MRALVTFSGTKEGDKIEITFTPDDTKFNAFYRIEGEAQKFLVTLPDKPDQGDLE